MAKTKAFSFNSKDFVPNQVPAASAPPQPKANLTLVEPHLVPTKKRNNVPFQVQLSKEAVRAIKHLAIEKDCSHGEVVSEALKMYLKASPEVNLTGDNPVKKFLST